MPITEFTNPPHHIRNIIGVVFDLDGTLIDDELHRIKHEQILLSLDLPAAVPTEEDWYIIAGITEKEGYAHIASKAETAGALHLLPPFEQYMELVDEYFFKNLHLLEMREGASELLDTSLFRGLPMSICTNGSEQETWRKLKHVQIEHMFNDLSCVDHVPRGKPFPDIYLDSFRKMQAILGDDILTHPWQLLAIEDTDTGAKAAIQAGYRVILWESEKRRSKLRPHPNLLVTRNIDDILTVLEQTALAAPRMQVRRLQTVLAP